jgi:hypothetical protein
MKNLDGFNDDGESWRQIGKMEGSFSTGQRPQWAVVPVEEEDECYCTTEKCVS